MDENELCVFGVGKEESVVSAVKKSRTASSSGRDVSKNRMKSSSAKYSHFVSLIEGKTVAALEAMNERVVNHIINFCVDACRSADSFDLIPVAAVEMGINISDHANILQQIHGGIVNRSLVPVAQDEERKTKIISLRLNSQSCLTIKRTVKTLVANIVSNIIPTDGGCDDTESTGNDRSSRRTANTTKSSVNTKIPVADRSRSRPKKTAAVLLSSGPSDDENYQSSSTSNCHRFKDEPTDVSRLQNLRELTDWLRKTGRVSKYYFVLILDDFEAFPSEVLSHFIQICRINQMKGLGIMLVFGMSTGDFVMNEKLDIESMSEILPKTFQFPSPQRCWSTILSNTCIMADDQRSSMPPFRPSHSLLTALESSFFYDHFSARSFMSQYKFALLQHCLRCLEDGNNKEMDEIMNVMTESTCSSSSSSSSDEKKTPLYAVNAVSTTAIQKAFQLVDVPLTGCDSDSRRSLVDWITTMNSYLANAGPLLRILHVFLEDLPDGDQEANGGKLQFEQLYLKSLHPETPLVAQSVFKNACVLWSHWEQGTIVQLLEAAIRTVKRGNPDVIGVHRKLTSFLEKFNNLDKIQAELDKGREKEENVLKERNSQTTSSGRMNRFRMQEELKRKMEERKDRSALFQIRLELINFLVAMVRQHFPTPTSLPLHQLYFMSPPVPSAQPYLRAQLQSHLLYPGKHAHIKDKDLTGTSKLFGLYRVTSAKTVKNNAWLERFVMSEDEGENEDEKGPFTATAEKNQQRSPPKRKATLSRSKSCKDASPKKRSKPSASTASKKKSGKMTKAAANQIDDEQMIGQYFIGLAELEILGIVKSAARRPGNIQRLFGVDGDIVDEELPIQALTIHSP